MLIHVLGKARNLFFTLLICVCYSSGCSSNNESDQGEKPPERTNSASSSSDNQPNEENTSSTERSSNNDENNQGEKTPERTNSASSSSDNQPNEENTSSTERSSNNDENNQGEKTPERTNSASSRKDEIQLSIGDLMSITSSNVAAYEISGVCASDGEEIDVSVGDAGESTECADNAWSVTMDLTRWNKVQEVIIHAVQQGESIEEGVENRFECPENYIGVPALAGYGEPVDPSNAGENYPSKSFCVAKYEMKNVGGKATSQPRSPPWVHIKLEDANGKCTGITMDGYDGSFDLITNDEWQTIARNIEDVPNNWRLGRVKIYKESGSFNTYTVNRVNNGHSFNIQRPLEVSSNAQNSWDKDKRSHLLSNGEIIFDLSGNVWEWVQYDGDLPVLESDHPIIGNKKCACNNQLTENVREAFGGRITSENCSYLLGPFYCVGLGSINVLSGQKSITRGGSYGSGDKTSGVFAVESRAEGSRAGEGSAKNIGFRCAYHPKNQP